MQPPAQHRKWIWIARGALIVYCLLAGILILQRPGLYYDEALTELAHEGLDRGRGTEIGEGGDAVRDESQRQGHVAALAEGIRFERRLFHAMFGLADQKEGMAAFVEKRPAKFEIR